MPRFMITVLLFSLTALPALADHHEEAESATAVHPIVTEVKSQLGKRSSDKPFVMMVTLKPKSGQASKIVAGMKKATPPTRAEEGNTAYLLLQSPTDSESFVVYERWKSVAALEAHMKTPHIIELLKDLEPVLAEPPSMQVMKPLYFNSKK